VIYICIPALNEARTIGVLLWKIRQVMEEFPRDYHVLVLDDGSTDDTREVLEPYARVLPVTVLRNEKTAGYAPAVERLIREAVRLSTHPKRDAVVVMQGDFTESPDDIPHLLKRLEGGADVVGTAVTGTEGELPRSLRWSRRGLPWLLSRAPLPKEIRDPLSGFRAYRVSVLKRALQDHDGRPLLTKHGWAANAELLLSVTPHVRRAEDAEVSLRYTRRERPTRFRPWSTAVELWNLARRAPRRLAEARAAAAKADAQHPQAPPRAPEPAAAEAPRQPRPQRAPEATTATPTAAAPSPERTRPPRNRNRGRSRGERQQGDAQPPGDRQPRRAPQAEPRPPAGDAAAEMQGQAAASGEERPARRRRSQSERRKKKRQQAAAEAQAAAGDAESPSVDQPAATAEAAEAPPKRKRPPRPRRPRKPKSEGAAGEAGGGELVPGGDGDRGDVGGGDGSASGGEGGGEA
jgi:glycosyl transferase family 2